MIQPEHILDSTEDTGYRLCASGKPIGGGAADDKDSNKVFSAHWDPNDLSRLFICSQNGVLRVVDTKNEYSMTYNVFFRRYVDSTNGGSGEPTKLISRHWDKMVLIPNRPDEIIFLLGISNKILYTALPAYSEQYPDEPYISKTTRNDYKEYIYGTPILELWSHNNRITSMSVSQYGEILASGDEDGRVKVLVLNPLDEFKLSKNKKYKKEQSAKVFDGSVNYKLSKIAHKGPILSLKLLQAKIVFPRSSDAVDGSNGGDFDPNMVFQLGRSQPKVSGLDFEDENATRYENNDTFFLFASGSTDNFVKIWSVYLSPKTGLKSIDMLMEFKIISSSILSLDSLIVNDIINSQTFQKGMFKKGSKLSKSNYNFTEKRLSQLPAGPLQSKANQLRNEELLDNKISANIIIAAGLSIGVVYVWNISDRLIFESFQRYYNEMSGLTNGGAFLKENAISGGSCIHSIIQVTDSPIIHLQISVENDKTANTTSSSSVNPVTGQVTVTEYPVTTWADTSVKRIIIAACDTESNVKVFFESDRSSINSFLNKDGTLKSTEISNAALSGTEESDGEPTMSYEARKALISTNLIANNDGGIEDTASTHDISYMSGDDDKVTDANIVLPCYRNKFGPFLSMAETQYNKTITFMGFQRFYHKNFVLKIFDALERSVHTSATSVVTKIGKGAHSDDSFFLGTLSYCLIADVRYILSNNYMMKPNIGLNTIGDASKAIGTPKDEPAIVYKTSLFDLLLLLDELGHMPLVDLENMYQSMTKIALWRSRRSSGLLSPSRGRSESERRETGLDKTATIASNVSESMALNSLISTAGSNSHKSSGSVHNKASSSATSSSPTRMTDTRESHHHSLASASTALSSSFDGLDVPPPPPLPPPMTSNRFESSNKYGTATTALTSNVTLSSDINLITESSIASTKSIDDAAINKQPSVSHRSGKITSSNVSISSVRSVATANDDGDATIVSRDSNVNSPSRRNSSNSSSTSSSTAVSNTKTSKIPSALSSPSNKNILRDSVDTDNEINPRISAPIPTAVAPISSSAKTDVRTATSSNTDKATVPSRTSNNANNDNDISSSKGGYKSLIPNSNPISNPISNYNNNSADVDSDASSEIESRREAIPSPFISSKPVSSSAASFPAINSTRLIEAKLKKLQQPLDLDDITVSTVSTTASDRAAALRASLGYRRNFQSGLNADSISSSISRPVIKGARNAPLSSAYLQKKCISSIPGKESINKVLYAGDPILQVPLSSSHSSGAVTKTIDDKSASVITSSLNKDTLDMTFATNFDLSKWFHSKGSAVDHDPLMFVKNDFESISEDVLSGQLKYRGVL